jgi:membrane protein YqaA with SNARE-associated domain
VEELLGAGEVGEDRLRRSKAFLLASYGLLLILGAAALIDRGIAESVTSLGKGLRDWSKSSPSRMHAYLASFLISIFGNTTIFIPFPYTAIIFIMTSQVGLDPLLLGLISGLGAALGELTSYALGAGGGRYLESHGYTEKFRSLHEFMLGHKRLVPLVIYIFAATPLPDDIITVPLGIIRYGLIQTIIPCFLGKTTMLLCIGYLGSFVSGMGESFQENPVTGMIFDLAMIAFIITLVYVIVEYDWTKLLKNARAPKPNRENPPSAVKATG